ncbi:glycosyltransferase [Pedobacter sp. PWIIR3]
MKKIIKKLASFFFSRQPPKTPIIGAEKTILVIDDYVPYHDKSSGSKRLFELLKLFKSLDLNIIFLPDDGKLTQPYATDLQSIGIEILHFENKNDLIKKLNSKLNSIHYAWISRPALNEKYQNILNINTKKIFDTVDLHYLRMLRQAANEHNQKLKAKALKTKSIELSLAKKSDATITVIAVEKDTLKQEGINNVFVIPNVHYSSVEKEQPEFINRKGLLFIGGYKHTPNIDAARWLVNDIMPMIWKTDPTIHLTLLGSDPTPEIQGFSAPNISVPGYIHDVSPFFNNNKIFIAPLRYGAGMKGKIGQSLEFGLPVISTDIGVEGMDLHDGKNVLLANTTEEFAEKALTLYNSEVLWNQIRDNSIQAISDYAPAAVTRMLKLLFDTIDE